MSELKNQIDQAMKRNRDLRGAITVPEWSTDPDNPITVYYHQPTAREAQKIHRMAEGDYYMSLIYALIYALEDEEGNKLFSVEDKNALLSEPNPLIHRLAETIAERPPLQEQAKNS